MSGNESQRAIVERVVLSAIETINLAREPESRMEESLDAAMYGEGSPLDSLGLVSLLLEIEEGLADEGVQISLSDERAMSQKQSPFRDVPALLAYIEELLNAPSL